MTGRTGWQRARMAMAATMATIALLTFVYSAVLCLEYQRYTHRDLVELSEFELKVIEVLIWIRNHMPEGGEDPPPQYDPPTGGGGGGAG